MKKRGKRSQAYYLSIIHMIKVLHNSIALPYTLQWLPDKMWRAKNVKEKLVFYLTQGTKVMKYFEILDDGIAISRAMATKRVNTLIKVLRVICD